MEGGRLCNALLNLGEISTLTLPRYVCLSLAVCFLSFFFFSVPFLFLFCFFSVSFACFFMIRTLTGARAAQFRTAAGPIRFKRLVMVRHFLCINLFMSEGGHGQRGGARGKERDELEKQRAESAASSAIDRLSSLLFNVSLAND